MARPVVSVVAERTYQALGPLTDGDEQHEWALLHLCHALTLPVAAVEAVAADTDSQTGWAPVLDPDLAPAVALPWLGQFVGAEITPSLSTAQARALIRAAPGHNRGTPAAIKDAARLWLTGTQLVTVNERSSGDAYAFEVIVYAAQVVDLAQLTASIQAAKPAGLAMTVTLIPGWSIADLEAYTAGTVHALEVDGTTDTVLEVETHLP